MNRRKLLLGVACTCVAPVMCGAQGVHASARYPVEIDPALIKKLAATMASSDGEADRYDAEVWLHWVTPKIGRYMHDTAERTLLVTSVHRQATLHQIDPDLLLSVIDVESRFDRYAVSRAGAQGVMQIMPFWKDVIGRQNDNLIRVDTNIRYGATILTHYIERSKGDLVSALARYNGSHGLLNYPERVMFAWRHRWQSRLTGEIPEMVAGCSHYQLDACTH